MSLSVYTVDADRTTDPLNPDGFYSVVRHRPGDHPGAARVMAEAMFNLGTLSEPGDTWRVRLAEYADGVGELDLVSDSAWTVGLPDEAALDRLFPGGADVEFTVDHLVVAPAPDED